MGAYKHALAAIQASQAWISMSNPVSQTVLRWSRRWDPYQPLCPLITPQMASMLLAFWLKECCHQRSDMGHS